MPDLGRWNGIDKLAEKYYGSSPYAYVSNNPISFFDPDGRVTMDWITGLHKKAGGNGATLYSGFDSNGNYSSATFSAFTQMGTATAFQNFLESGQTGTFRYWTGGKDSTTGYMSNGAAYMSGDIGTLNQVSIKDNIPLDAYKNWADKSGMALEGIYSFIAEQRSDLYNRGYWIDNLGQMRSTAYAGRARGSFIGLRADYVRTTTKFTKYAERAGMVGNVISVGEVTYGVYEDGWKFGKNAQIATAGAIGGLVGAAEGALIGAYIGSFIPVPGAGTILGIVIGAGVGYVYGEIASQTVEKMYE